MEGVSVVSGLCITPCISANCHKISTRTVQAKIFGFHEIAVYLQRKEADKQALHSIWLIIYLPVSFNKNSNFTFQDW